VAQDQPEKAQQLVLEHVKRNIYHLIDTKLTLSYAASSQELGPLPGRTKTKPENGSPHRAWL
jgi:hypothetical protein